MKKKTVLITGAARGIGFATAQAMASDGWNVGLLDRDEDALHQAAQQIPDAKALMYDVSNPSGFRTGHCRHIGHLRRP